MTLSQTPAKGIEEGPSGPFSFCVVGNGGERLNEHTGAIIDAHDFIARCNQAWRCFGPLFGYRTDVLVAKSTKSKKQWCKENGVEHWACNVPIDGMTGRHFSRGSYAIARVILRYHPTRIFVAGCEGLMDGRKNREPYYSGKRRCWQDSIHSWNNERNFLDRMCLEHNTELVEINEQYAPPRAARHPC